MNFYNNETTEVIQTLDTSLEGLSVQEADKRLLKNGRNELIKAKKKSLLARFIAQFINPMIMILLVAALISLSLAYLHGGDFSEYIEAIIIMAVLVINSLLGVFQESKSEKAIEALQEMSATTATVRRNGGLVEVPAAELVSGDIVVLEAGDAIPADMRLLESFSLRIEEATLTGESVPVEKITTALSTAGEGEDKVPLGDRKNMAYLGSTVVYGRGLGVVCATGMATEMGKIATIIQETQAGETPLQKRMDQLSKVLTWLTIAICVVIFAVRIFSNHDFSGNAILDSFMLAISLAVAAIPEGLAAVITIVLSIGVTNMAKRSAIIRRLTAVETLGCAQIICSDKTGTLTQNKMTVVDYYGDKELLALSMALCCDSQVALDGEIVGDPTENALIAFAQNNGLLKNEIDKKYPRIGEAPFDSSRKMMSTLHKTDKTYVQYSKGAPDEILKACSKALVNGKVVALSEEVKNTILTKNHQFSEKALRVLAGAYKEFADLPDNYERNIVEKDLVFIGLQAMIDPIRPEVRAAVDACRSSGIQVVMITGDHRDTAAAIAKELDVITDDSQAITGAMLDEMNDEEFEKAVANIHVYARVQPEHKVRIVNMWKEKGYVTAMTGDGVNDAPAIKSGDIGIGMGITGTDVTKNVADMVLADDNFATIVAAVEEGRRIYDNIRRTIQFLLSSNLSEVVTIFVATMAGFVLFKPVHLLFVNLVTDSLPAIALGMEPAQSDIMKRPPRGKNDGVFSNGLGVDVVYQGLLIAILVLASYFIIDGLHDNHEYAMTSALFTINMCEIFHAYNMRSFRGSIFSIKGHNKILWLAMFFSLILSLMIIYVPGLNTIFSLQPLALNEILISGGLALSIIPLVEIVKFIQRKLKI